MGVVKGAAVIGAAGIGTVALLGALENMDAETIREYGDKIGGFVANVGEKAKGSEIGQQIIAKLNETQYGPQVMEFASSAGTTVSGGFDKLVDALAESREAADANGTSVAGELTARLTGLVADGAEYAAEHLDGIKDAGKTVLTNALGFGGSEPAAEAETPDNGLEMDI